MLHNSLFSLLYMALTSVTCQPAEDICMQDAHAISAQAFSEKVKDAGGQVDFVFGMDRPFPECHASTLVHTADGSVIVAWFAGTKEKDPDVGIWTARYANNAWSPPVLMVKIEESAHWNPVLFRDAEQQIHLFFKVGPEISGWRTYWMSSADHGLTWSEPRELVAGDAGGRGPVRNKPIILSDGSWLAPASTEVRLWESFADRSEDRGATWHRSADFEIDRSEMRGKGAIQPTFWESQPGRVHALVRTTAGRSWRADSEDYGKTWTPLTRTCIPNNNSSLDAVLLEDGRLLLVLNPVAVNWGPRTPLSLAVSRDNGETWKILAHFEDDAPGPKIEYSYPFMIRTREGIAVCYTHRRERIRYWHIPLSVLDALAP